MPSNNDFNPGKRGSGKKNANCSFCRKSYREVGPLVEGPDDVYICGECIELCQSILDQERRRRGPAKQLFTQVPTPREIVTHLKRLRHRPGAHQKSARGRGPQPLQAIDAPRRLPAAMWRSKNPTSCSSAPPAAGKRCSARTLARYLQVPFAIGDATTLTEAGYVGEDVENLLLKLLHAADFDIEAAQRGILFIDEIDKIGKTSQNVSHHPRRVRRRRAASPVENARRHRRQRPAPRRPQASRAAIHPDRHDQHPVHLRRNVCGLGRHHRQKARQEDASASALRSAARWPPATANCWRKPRSMMSWNSA